MAGTINDILLRVRGEGDDAKRMLAGLAKDLAVFGKQEAEAEASIDTTAARLKLAEVQKTLESIDGKKVSANVGLDIGELIADAAIVEGILDRIDNREIDVDTGDLNDRLGALARRTANVSDELLDAGHTAERTGSLMQKGGVSLGFMTLRFGTLLKILPLLIPLFVGVVAQVSALIASASFAVAGLGALANAFLFALIPAIGLGVAAFLRFKETMDKAGTPANKIKRFFEDMGPVFDRLKKAADPVLRAVAGGLDGIERIVRRLVPAFVKFGQQGAAAVRWLMNALDQPAVGNAIADLVRLAGPVLKPLTQAFFRVGRVVLNLARAAMPFLQRAMQDLANVLGGAVRTTGDMERMRGVIGTLVGHTRTWMRFLGSVIGLAKDLFVVIAPYGRQMVETLREGADKLREWIRSEEGTRRIKAFFRDVLPLADAVVDAIGKLIKIGLQLGQALAPVLAPIVRGFNDLLDAVSWVVEKFNDIPGPIRGVIGVVISFVVGIGKIRKAGELVRGAIRLLVAAFGVLGGAVKDAWNFVKRNVDNIKDKVQTVFRNVSTFVRNIWGNIKDAVGNAITNAKEKVANVVDAIREKVSNVFRGIADAARTIWGSIKDAISTIFSNAKDAVVRIADGIWEKIKSAFENVKETVGNAMQAVVDKIGNIAETLFNKAKNVGGRIIDGLVSGIRGAIGAITDALGWLVDQIVNTVESLLGIASPSRVFMGIGKHMLDGLIRGFTSGDITGFVTKHLGGMAELAWKLIKKGMFNISLDDLPSVGNLLGPLGIPLQTFLNVTGIDLPGIKDIPGVLTANAGDEVRAWIQEMAEEARDRARENHNRHARGVVRASPGWKLIGEEGPELVNLPGGASVFPSTLSKQIMDAIGKGGGDTYVTIPQVVGGGPPDPDHLAALLALAQSGRGDL